MGNIYVWNPAAGKPPSEEEIQKNIDENEEFLEQHRKPNQIKYEVCLTLEKLTADSKHVIHRSILDISEWEFGTFEEAEAHFDKGYKGWFPKLYKEREIMGNAKIGDGETPLYNGSIYETPCWRCTHAEHNTNYGYKCTLGIRNENGYCDDYEHLLHWTEKLPVWVQRVFKIGKYQHLRGW